MFVVDSTGEKLQSLPAMPIKAADAKNFSSELAQKIMKLLVEKPMYPIQITKVLKVHEQKVYYHIRNLEAIGAIKVVKEEQRQGATAKYYAAQRPAFVIKFKELEATNKPLQAQQDTTILQPFIQNGVLDATIVVGSPDPHGPEKARAKDGYFAIDLGLFLGTFLQYVPKLSVKLDTEVRDKDLQQNLIVIGGPIVNQITAKINPKLPIKFDKDNHYNVHSSYSTNDYAADEIGIIVKAKNPFNPDKQVLVVAGKRHAGTRAAILAFIKHYDKLIQGNVHKKAALARVVEGIDLNSDGIVDDVEFRE